MLSRMRAALGVEVALGTVFESPTLRAFAAAVDSQRFPARPPAPAIARLARPAGAPLVVGQSFFQQGLWFLYRLAPSSPAYVVPIMFNARGSFDHCLLERAIGALVERHEILRTTFADLDGEPVQVVAPEQSFSLSIVDVRNVPEPEREAAVAALVDRNKALPFDLARGPLLRATVIECGQDQCVLWFEFHHIVVDEWSLELFFGQLHEMYAHLANGGPPAERGGPPLQYADFAAWQLAQAGGARWRAQLDYWRAALDGMPELLQLPTDRPRPPVQSHRGALVRGALSPQLSAAVRALAHTHGLTLHMVLFGAWAILLARLSNQYDLVVGTPVASRPDEAHALIGCFVNTLPIRIDVSDNPTTAVYLARVRERMLGAYAHQDVPLEHIVEAVAPRRELGYNPLFVTMLVLQHAARDAFSLGPLALSPRALEECSSKVDLSVLFADRGTHLGFELEFATDLFDASTVQRIADQLGCLLEAMVADPACPVLALRLLSVQARAQLLQEFNTTAVAYPAQATIHGLFAAQAARTPDALAVEHGEHRLSYGELDGRGHRLGHHHRAPGVEAGALVGVCLPRSAELVVALLAILKASAAYVPIDPSYPPWRQAQLIEDSGACLVLAGPGTAQQVAKLAPVAAGRAGMLDLGRPELGRALAACSRAEVAAAPGECAADLAYLIYTSGSTGQPKAVEIRHRNAVARISWGGHAYSAAELARVLFSTSINFDLSVFELFVPLCHGGAVVVVDNALSLLRQAVSVSLINTVPSSCRALLEHGVIGADVLAINLAGEELPAALVDALFETTAVRRVCNLYGPSEDTTYSTCDSMTRAPRHGVSIGRPLDNTRVYILDQYGEPVPIGTSGEIHVAGAGVGRGYRHRPDLTAQRFGDDPFYGGGERMYRTGDLGRWLPDGRIAYLGRNDFQVKIRGFRIEPGEVEAQLGACPGVRDAVVVVREDAAGDKCLVAYLTPAKADGAASLAETARAVLAARLPGYMIPSVFQILAAMPLTPNGKVDRTALPAPAAQAQPESRVAPRTALERLIANIWQEQLGVQTLGIDDDFFRLGGHSLSAVRVLSRLQSILRYELTLAQLFFHPTVRELAAALTREDGGRALDELAAAYLYIAGLSAEEVACALRQDD
jgi:amino acid adenylation domain-containing protein